jgi:hypothetical protein
VHQGSNTMPTWGQATPYTLFNYSANGQVSRRDRRYANGLHQDLDLLWDGDDRIRQVNDRPTATMLFSPLYDGDGIRVKKTDTRGGLGLQVHDFSYGPGGCCTRATRTRCTPRSWGAAPTALTPSPTTAGWALSGGRATSAAARDRIVRMRRR